MRTITVTELRRRLGRYIELSKSEDIIIIRNGKAIAMLSSSKIRRSSAEDFLALAGKYESFDYHRALHERDLQR